MKKPSNTKSITEKKTQESSKSKKNASPKKQKMEQDEDDLEFQDSDDSELFIQTSDNYLSTLDSEVFRSDMNDDEDDIENGI